MLFSQPAQTDVDATIVWGLNHHHLTAGHRVVSAGSCTTNAITPVLSVIAQAFGVQAGTITTIHSAMNDQPVLDAYHHTDLRKTRAAFHSIIPVDTGLAVGIQRILPELAGKLTAHAIRVPTLNVSAIDLTVACERTVTPDAANEVFAEAAQGALAGVLGYTEAPLASCDFSQQNESGIVDASHQCQWQQSAQSAGMADNEWAYAQRLLDLIRRCTGWIIRRMTMLLCLIWCLLIASIIREDLNVLIKDGRVTSDASSGGSADDTGPCSRAAVYMSHLGRPKEEPDKVLTGACG